MASSGFSRAAARERRQLAASLGGFVDSVRRTLLGLDGHNIPSLAAVSFIHDLGRYCMDFARAGWLLKGSGFPRCDADSRRMSRGVSQTRLPLMASCGSLRPASMSASCRMSSAHAAARSTGRSQSRRPALARGRAAAFARPRARQPSRPVLVDLGCRQRRPVYAALGRLFRVAAARRVRSGPSGVLLQRPTRYA